MSTLIRLALQDTPVPRAPKRRQRAGSQRSAATEPIAIQSQPPASCGPARDLLAASRQNCLILCCKLKAAMLTLRGNPRQGQRHATTLEKERLVRHGQPGTFMDRRRSDQVAADSGEIAGALDTSAHIPARSVEPRCLVAPNRIRPNSFSRPTIRRLRRAPSSRVAYSAVEDVDRGPSSSRGSPPLICTRSTIAIFHGRQSTWTS